MFLLFLLYLIFLASISSNADEIKSIRTGRYTKGEIPLLLIRPVSRPASKPSIFRSPSPAAPKITTSEGNQ